MDDGEMSVDHAPDGASFEVDWGVYDGHRTHRFTSERMELHDGVLRALSLEQVPSDVQLDLDGPLSIEAWVYAIVDGRRGLDRKLPARPFELVDGVPTPLALEAHALPPEVEAILPERLRGHAVTTVAVASDRTEAPTPAYVDDNEDKTFDLTREPVVVRNVDLMKPPVDEARVRGALERAGLIDRLEAVVLDHEAMSVGKAAAVDAHAHEEVSP